MTFRQLDKDTLKYVTARLNSDTPDFKIGDLVTNRPNTYTDEVWYGRTGVVTKIIKSPLYRDSGRLSAMRWVYEVHWANGPVFEDYLKEGVEKHIDRSYNIGTKMGTHNQCNLGFADYRLNVIFIALMEDDYQVNNLKYRSEKVDRSKFKELPIHKHLLKQLIK